MFRCAVYGLLRCKGALGGTANRVPPIFQQHDSSRLRVQLQPQRPDDFQYRGEFGITFRGQRLVQTFASQPGVAGELRHALGAGDPGRAPRARYPPGQYAGVAFS